MFIFKELLDVKLCQNDRFYNSAIETKEQKLSKRFKYLNHC